MSDTPGSEDLPSFLGRFFANEIGAWRGEADLGRVFWVNGVLTSAVLMVLLQLPAASRARTESV